MCAEIIVTTRDARALITQPGNPHMVWDGQTAWVMPAWYYDLYHQDSGWQLIMTRADLLATDPEAVTYEPAYLATLLTTFADSLAVEQCPCTGS